MFAALKFTEPGWLSANAQGCLDESGYALVRQRSQVSRVGDTGGTRDEMERNRFQTRTCQSNRYGTAVAKCSAPVAANNWRIVY